jgi:hypothetical protein
MESLENLVAIAYGHVAGKLATLGSKCQPHGVVNMWRLSG